MNRNRRTIRLTVATILILVAVGLLLFDIRSEEPEAVSSARGEGASQISVRPPGPPPRFGDVPLPPAADTDEDAPDEKPDDAEFAKYLADKFGPSIANKHTQIKAVEKLIAYLKKFYPDDWQSRLLEFLKQAFPDRADELYAQFEKLTEYNAWLEQNRAEVMKMSVDERRGTLWDLRYKIFGKDAQEIWQAVLKGEQIHDALEVIAESHDKTVDDKFGLYLDVVRSTWGERADQFIQQRNTELVNHFLSVEAVQDNLHALPPEQRSATLRTIRRGVGMDDAALQRWDELDARRDQAWETGQTYMREREKLAAAAGKEQRQQLRELRLRFFGEEAEVVQSEEDAGFFRFDHRRVFGKE